MARRLVIEGRHHRRMLWPTSRQDFACRAVGSVDAACVTDDPDLSLYCLDVERRRALFVRTRTGADPARAPFMYQAQFEAATELLSLSFEELHEVAAPCAQPERIVFVHSVGRCGSTLAINALASCDQVVALSEPNVYDQLHLLRDRGDPATDALIKSCTKVLFAPRLERTGAIKFRSMHSELVGPLMRCFPDAFTVFLYRHADTWALSAARAYGLLNPVVVRAWRHIAAASPRVRSVVDPPQPAPFPSPVAFLAWLWTSSMVRGQEIARAGWPAFIARFEDIQRDRLAVLTELLGSCHLAPDEARLREVVAVDSQERTLLSRANRGEETIPVADFLDEFRRRAMELAPQLCPDVRLPETFVA